MHRARTHIVPLPTWLLAALVPVALLPAQDASDVVLRKDGKSIRGAEVTAFTLKGVAYQRGGETGEVPSYLVLDIEWGNAPEVFVTARAALDRGDYANAQQLFGEAASKAERAVLKAEARFLQGKAGVGAAGTDASAAAAAAGGLRAWLTEFSDHGRVPEAMLLLGRALRLGGLGADAEAALKDLDNRAGGEGWGAVWSARAKYELALAQLGQDKALDARSSFQSAGAAATAALATPSADTAELQAIKVNARTGEGETFVRERNFPRALEYYRAMATGSDATLRAAGRAGEGEATYLAAGEGKAPDELRKAQLALAEASVLDLANGEASAKANYYLGLCLLGLGPAREGDTYKARAMAYFQIVARYYPTSRWAAAARAELAR
jgi:hypothetical protein